MSDYRRLISYIYAYEGGVKGKNIGFAKIEVRGEQCRIYVSVKKIYVGSNDIGVYLLSPSDEILLGRIFVRGGTGEFRMNVSSSNIEGSGCPMKNCYGLTIHDVEKSTWQCYTTIWEDAVTQAAEMTLAEVTAENVRNQEEVQAESETCEAQVASQETLPQAFPISAEIERELDAEEEMLEKVAPWEGEPEMTVESEAAVEPEMTAESKAAAEAEMTVESKAAVEAEMTVESEAAAEPQMDAEPDSILPPEPEDTAKLQELDRQEQEELSKSHLWNRLQRRYTKVLAFDYDNGCEILSIKPQDIGLLPRDIWVYGNNSFLLHGYYNYRHLILAKLNNPQGEPRYLIGVPGHYFSNEKYMASMFGFPHFVLARRQPENDGRFGYWYTDIRL